MRNYCIETNIRQTYGIMTNFKEWIFTRYNLASEGAKIIEKNEGGSNVSSHINPFEMSQVFRVVKNDKINSEELYKVIKMIQFLYI